MNSRRWSILIGCAALLAGCGSDLATVKRECVAVDRAPIIQPEYAGITIPPNIAPLHFTLRDSCTACIVEFASRTGPSVIVRSRNNSISIPAAPWKRLLSKNAGNPLNITIYARDHRRKWHRYPTIENRIAAEPVDRFCTYRLLSFQYNYTRDIRECQRDLTTFDETVLINTQHYKVECVNCHIPQGNNPEKFVLQVRSTAYGSQTLLSDRDGITTLSSRLGHTAWQPAGRYLAFSVYKVQQYFHAVGRQFIDAYDNRSGIVIYDVTARKIVPVPQLNREGALETWPAWSPDGRFLYFCSAPVPWDDYDKEPPDHFNATGYSLLRIGYDAAAGSWGETDTLLSAGTTSRSISQPKLSPDNRFLLFCMHDAGAYPHTQASSDLYLMDIATRNYRKLPVNSDYNESWHSWSNNSRWILFSSKRGDGIFTRLYLAYVDSMGNARKPFLLPQRDPKFYDSFLYCYNVAEFATAPVRFSERQLLRAIKTKNPVRVPIPPETAVHSDDTAAGKWSPVGNRE